MDATAFYNMFKKDPNVLTEFVKALEMIERDQNFPSVGDKFYFVHPMGYVVQDDWMGKPADINLLETGNCFRDERDARRALNRINTISRYNKLGRPFRRGYANVRPVYDPESNEFSYVYCTAASEGVYFSSEKEAKDAVEKIGGKEEFIRHVLGLS